MKNVYLVVFVPDVKVFHARAHTSRRKAELWIKKQLRPEDIGEIIFEWLADTCKITVLGNLDAIAWIHKTLLR